MVDYIYSENVGVLTEKRFYSSNLPEISEKVKKEIAS